MVDCGFLVLELIKRKKSNVLTLQTRLTFLVFKIMIITIIQPIRSVFTRRPAPDCARRSHAAGARTTRFNMIHEKAKAVRCDSELDGREDKDGSSRVFRSWKGW